MRRQQSSETKSLLLLILVIAGTICGQVTNVSRTKISGFWQLRIDYCPNPQFTGLVLNSTIPTVLHLDLQNNNKINDPFFGDNHKVLQWISSCNITYSKNLTIPKAHENKTIQLIFEGIDTYSLIKFNGKQLLITNNSFVQYRIQLNKNDIKYGQHNLIQVHIYSPNIYDSKAQNSHNMPFIYAHSRKAAYQYGWDWAPKLVTMGIWKDVYIMYYQQVVIDYVWIRNREITQQQAILNFAINLKTISNINGKYVLQVYDNNTKLGSTVVTQLQNYVDVKINSPKLWWPNGIGEQNLYNFVVKLINIAGSVVTDTKNVLYGIRTVQLDRSENKFTVIVNGYPIYCKGANYVPTDMFYPRTANPDFSATYNYKQLLNDVVDSHFNMIRVWGGGQYQSNQFLQLAAKKGIMIFYDFMFSDSIYPSHKEMLQNIQTQITQQVRRARNYPCLILWSGNNEILQGIKSWGWSRGSYPNDYKRIFQQTIPAILKKENPQTPYIPSSPVNGIGNVGFQRGGDIHYWGVWAAGVLFQAYMTAIGPFNSQFGTQGIPVWQTVKNFTSVQQRNYGSAHFDSHQKHNSRFSTLNKYHSHYAHQPIDFQHKVYMSGLVQAYGVQIAIKYQRASKPKSFGTLYWQLNDAWPAISWSSIDYFGRWKPLQYMAKRLYPDVAIYCINNKIVAINDNLYPVNALAKLTIQYFNGTVDSKKTYQVSLSPNQVKQIDKINPSLYSDTANRVVVHTQIVAGREKQMTSTHFLDVFKQLKLDSSAKLYVKIIDQHNLLILKTDKFIKNLYISSTKEYLKLSDNYFDMIAQKVYKIKLDKKYKLQQIKQTLQFRSYIQIHSSDKLTVVYQENQLK